MKINEFMVVLLKESERKLREERKNEKKLFGKRNVFSNFKCSHLKQLRLIKPKKKTKIDQKII